MLVVESRSAVLENRGEGNGLTGLGIKGGRGLGIGGDGFFFNELNEFS